MAKKRMFNLDVTDTDDFLDMPVGAQALYFHLGMHGDDDGFVANAKRIMRTTGCKPGDLRMLVSKGYLIPFDSGIMAIRDWRINNDLKNDRYRKTIYTEERDMLILDDSRRYIWDDFCLRSGNTPDTEHNVT